MESIIQWIPLIKKIQGLGKSVVVYINTSELELFIKEISACGIFLNCYEPDTEVQKLIIDRLEKWK